MRYSPVSISLLPKLLVLGLSGVILAGCGDDKVDANIKSMANQPAVGASEPKGDAATDTLSAEEMDIEPESTIQPLSEEAAQQQRYTELSWDDLVPADFDFQTLRDKIDLDQYDIQSLEDDDPEAQRLYSDLQSVMADVPFIYALDGQEARIPGFLVPLEMDADAVSEFFLVPYFGACIHTPPPPANQIVHVVLDEAIPFDNIYEPYWIQGTLSVTRTETDIGTAGYRMKATDIMLYE